MFYNYDLLCQRAGGKFSLVWLAATRKSLPANDYLRINIEKTCLDIMEIIKNQEPRMTSKNARSRFSLYLSSMLLYGVCIVYRQQVIITIDNMMHLFHLTITCNGTQRLLEVSGEGGETDADAAKKGRKRKKQHQLQPVDEKLLAELTVPLKTPPQGITTSPRFSPNSHPPTVAMPPDVMQALKIPQMILDDKGTDAPVEQICEQLTKIFAAEELLVTESQKTEQPPIEDKPTEDQATAPVPISESNVPVTVNESVVSAAPPEPAESVNDDHLPNKDLPTAPVLLEQAHKDSDLKPPSPPKVIESFENKEAKMDSIDADATISHQMTINVPEVQEPVTDSVEAKEMSVAIVSDKTTEIPATRASRRRISPEQPQEVPNKRKRGINVLFEDEEVEISKQLLRVQIGKDDTELRAVDIEKEIKSCISPKNTKFLIENPCCLDLPAICQILITKTYQMNGGHLHVQQRQSNLEESVEIQRGQRTPTPPQTPQQSRRDEGSSLLRNEISDITPKLPPIIEAHFEEMEVMTKADSVINVAPLAEIPEIDTSSISIGKEKRDSNLEKIMSETAQQREAEHRDVEMVQPTVIESSVIDVVAPQREAEHVDVEMEQPVVGESSVTDVIAQQRQAEHRDIEMVQPTVGESSVTDVINPEIMESAVCEPRSDGTELPTDTDKVSKPLKETINVWRRLKILQKSINRTVTVKDLCPVHSTTKFRAAITFKCLLELDFQKKVILQQDRSIPFGPIRISVP